jgi:hypothetical protein
MAWPFISRGLSAVSCILLEAPHDRIGRLYDGRPIEGSGKGVGRHGSRGMKIEFRPDFLIDLKIIWPRLKGAFIGLMFKPEDIGRSSSKAYAVLAWIVIAVAGLSSPPICPSARSGRRGRRRRRRVPRLVASITSPSSIVDFGQAFFRSPSLRPPPIRIAEHDRLVVLGIGIDGLDLEKVASAAVMDLFGDNRGSAGTRKVGDENG